MCTLPLWLNDSCKVRNAADEFTMRLGIVLAKHLINLSSIGVKTRITSGIKIIKTLQRYLVKDDMYLKS